MRTLRSTVAFVALVNLLALVFLAGWLGSSGRLSAERLRAIRDLLAVPVAEAEAAEAEAAEDAERAAAEEAEATRRATAPLDSESMVRMTGMTRAVEQAAVRRIEDEADRIRRDLARREADLARREEQLAADRAAWLASIDEERARREDASFAALVARFEALKPELSRSMLQQWVDAGRMDVAVDVLATVDERNAAKVLGTFDDDAGRRVAFQLLDALRRRGRLLDGDPATAAGASEGAGAASGASDDDEPAGLPGTAAEPNGR